MKSGVYEIVCRITGKRYIGSSATLDKRRKSHLFSLQRGSFKRREHAVYGRASGISEMYVYA